MRLLDPKSDVVFKLLFAAPRHESLLIAFLTDVLRPAATITSATALNPEIPKDFTTEKSVILDVRATLSDGRLVDVEMQARRKPAFRERVLFYWARIFGAQLEIGEEYQRISPCVGIYVLDFADLQGHDFHSTFRLCNLKTSEILTDALQMHFFELPKVPVDDGDDPLQHWGQFFRIRTEQELEHVAMTSPTMKQASDALWWVSQDPNSRQLVEMRELADRAHRHTMAAARDEGREEGRAEGRQEGRAEGLRHELRTIAAVLGLDWSPMRQAYVDGLSTTELTCLAAILVERRNWPE